MGYKQIIFDLDGTLIDSIHGIALSMNSVLKEYNSPILSTETYKTLIGNGRKELVRKSLPKNLLKSNNLDFYYNLMNINYKKYWDYKMVPFPGIKKLLLQLQKKNFLLSINTNKDNETAKLVAKRFFNEINFDFIIGNMNHLNKKPSPDGANYIIQTSKIDRNKTLYIGDSEVDIQTAKNANLDSILVSWGYRTIAQLHTNGAKIIINKPSDILNYLV